MTLDSYQQRVVAETSRLRLRELAYSDHAELAKILADREVMHFSMRGPLTNDQTSAFIEANHSLYRERQFGMWAVEQSADGALIGFCGLSPIDLAGKEEIELGYRLTPSAWGKGLATEAACATVKQGINNCCLDSIIAIVASSHPASASVARKAGMSLETTTRFHAWEVDIFRYRRHDDKD
ncbi:GNAT family N-acetyltransferase [Salinicola lusitanus]|uniref:GNAT family N-acetyltransferase n=1 Tax=Salinicola lusitanus TaxID=1949085 RepID=UPI00130070A2